MSNILRTIGITIGSTTAGPAGALLGGLVSAGLESLFPAGGMLQQTVGDFSIETIRGIGQRVRQQASDPDGINADLQRAFHAALREALYDVSGQRPRRTRTTCRRGSDESICSHPTLGLAPAAAGSAGRLRRLVCIRTIPRPAAFQYR